MTEIEIIILIIALLLVVYLVTSYFLYKHLLFSKTKKNIQLVNPEDPFYQDSFSWFEKTAKEDIYISSYDGLKLHGIYIPSHDKKTNKTAIVLHGYQSKARDMVIIGKMYSDLGFRVILIDQRAHGTSQGKFTSMGYYEAYDLKKWIHFVNRSYGANQEILLYGISMGAASIFMASRFNELHSVKAIVSDACFTNFKDSLKRSTSHWIQQLFIPGVSFMSFVNLKFFLKSVNPLKYIHQIDVPVLFIHSEKDRVVSSSMTQELFQAAPSKAKDLLMIDDAKHAKAFETDSKKYIEKMIQFTSKIFKIKKSDIKFFE